MKKEDFPLLQSNIIYLDNAATTQKPTEVIDTIVDYYSRRNSNVHRGIYKLSEEATQLYEDSRIVVANFLNASSNEIVFTSGTTESINIISELLSYNGHLSEGDTILVSCIEHHSNFLPWQRIAHKNKAFLETIDINFDYELNIEDLLTRISKSKTKIIALSQVSNVLGKIIPIKKIIALVRKINPEIIFIIDAAQSIAHIKIDVKDLDCDFLVFSGHKIYGPTGTGIFFGKEKILKILEPIKLGGGMIEKVSIENTSFTIIPNKFEAGTPNIEGSIGLKTALEYIDHIGFDNIVKYEKSLTEYSFNKLREIEGINLYCTNTIDQIGVFSFNIDGIHPHDLAQILDESNICVRAGHHCAQILHREILKVSSSLRVSLSFYNDTQDIDFLVKKINEAKTRLQSL